jgi:protein phosphatase-4 regulatory subunit 3
LKVALTIVQSQAPLSLQQHLEITPDILNCSAEELEGELQPLMMAQAVPNPPPNDKKRVKVYELRNNDWFDRGTGFCTADFSFVRFAFMLLRFALPIFCILAWGQSSYLCGLILARLECSYPPGRAPSSRSVGR